MENEAKKQEKVKMFWCIWAVWLLFYTKKCKERVDGKDDLECLSFIFQIKQCVRNIFAKTKRTPSGIFVPTLSISFLFPVAETV